MALQVRTSCASTLTTNQIANLVAGQRATDRACGRSDVLVATAATGVIGDLMAGHGTDDAAEDGAGRAGRGAARRHGVDAGDDATVSATALVVTAVVAVATIVVAVVVTTATVAGRGGTASQARGGGDVRRVAQRGRQSQRRSTDNANTLGGSTRPETRTSRNGPGPNYRHGRHARQRTSGLSLPIEASAQAGEDTGQIVSKDTRRNLHDPTSPRGLEQTEGPTTPLG